MAKSFEDLLAEAYDDAGEASSTDFESLLDQAYGDAAPASSTDFESLLEQAYGGPPEPGNEYATGLEPAEDTDFWEGLKGVGRAAVSAVPFHEVLTGSPVISPVEEANLYREPEGFLDIVTDANLRAEALQGMSRGVFSRLAGGAAGSFASPGVGTVAGAAGAGAIQEAFEIARESKLDAMARGEDVADLNTFELIDRALDQRKRGKDITREEAATNMAARIAGGAGFDFLGGGLAGNLSEPVKKVTAEGIKTIAQSPPVRNALARRGLDIGMLGIETLQATNSALATQGILPGDEDYADSFADAVAQTAVVQGAQTAGVRAAGALSRARANRKSLTGAGDPPPPDQTPAPPPPPPEPTPFTAEEQAPVGLESIMGGMDDDDVPPGFGPFMAPEEDMSPVEVFPSESFEDVDFIEAEPSREFLTPEEEIADYLDRDVEGLFAPIEAEPVRRFPDGLPADVEGIEDVSLPVQTEGEIPPVFGRRDIISEGSEKRVKPRSLDMGEMGRVDIHREKGQWVVEPVMDSAPEGMMTPVPRSFRYIEDAQAYALEVANSMGAARREAGPFESLRGIDVPFAEGQVRSDVPYDPKPTPLFGEAPVDVEPSGPVEIEPSFGQSMEDTVRMVIREEPDVEPARMFGVPPSADDYDRSLVNDMAFRAAHMREDELANRGIMGSRTLAAHMEEMDPGEFSITNGGPRLVQENPEATRFLDQTAENNESVLEAAGLQEGVAYSGAGAFGRVGSLREAGGFLRDKTYRLLDDVQESLSRRGGDAARLAVRKFRDSASVIDIIRQQHFDMLKDRFGDLNDRQFVKTLDEVGRLARAVTEGDLNYNDLDPEVRADVDAVFDVLKSLEEMSHRSGLRVRDKDGGMRRSMLTGEREFFPVMIKKDVLDGLYSEKSTETEVLRDHMLSQGYTKAEAERVIGETFGPQNRGYFGGLESARKFKPPDDWLEPDVGKGIIDYIDRASRRITEVKYWGQDQALSENGRFGAKILREGESGLRWNRLKDYMDSQPESSRPIAYKDALKDLKSRDPNPQEMANLAWRMDKDAMRDWRNGIGELDSILKEMKRAGASRIDIENMQEAYRKTYGIRREASPGEDAVNIIGSYEALSKVTTNGLNPLLQVMALSNVIGDFGIGNTVKNMYKYAVDGDVRKRAKDFGVSSQNYLDLISSLGEGKSKPARALRAAVDWTARGSGITASDAYVRHLAALGANDLIDEASRLYNKSKHTNLTSAEKVRLETAKRTIGRWGAPLEEGTKNADMIWLAGDNLTDNQRKLNRMVAIKEAVIESQAGGGFLHENNLAAYSPVGQLALHLKKFGLRQMKTYFRLLDEAKDGLDHIRRGMSKDAQEGDKRIGMNLIKPLVYRVVAGVASGALYDSIVDSILGNEDDTFDEAPVKKLIDWATYGGVLGLVADWSRSAEYHVDSDQDPDIAARRAFADAIAPPVASTSMNLIGAAASVAGRDFEKVYDYANKEFVGVNRLKKLTEDGWASHIWNLGQFSMPDIPTTGGEDDR